MKIEIMDLIIQHILTLFTSQGQYLKYSVSNHYCNVNVFMTHSLYKPDYMFKN